MKGFCDHLVFTRKAVYFIEAKIGKDVLSEDQKRLKRIIQILSKLAKGVIFWEETYTLQEAKDLADKIFKNLR